MKKLLILLVAVLGISVVGCLPAKSGADAQRAAVAMAAEAVNLADQVCATLGTARKDAALLTTCKDAYNIARPALIVAQYYVQTGDQKGLEEELCIGVKGLKMEADAIVNAGGSIPPLVSEALHFAGSLCPAT